jgi:Trp operon repressor
MIWYKTGNIWLDQRMDDIIQFNSELYTPAALNSPLTDDEREALHRRFKSINSLLTKVAKREAKKRKK